MIMKSLETLFLPVTEPIKRKDVEATPSKHAEEASVQQPGKRKKKADTEWTRTLSIVQIQLGWERAAWLPVQRRLQTFVNFVNFI